jgi:hypothetical protein
MSFKHPASALHARLNGLSVGKDEQGRRDFCAWLLKRSTRVMSLKDLEPEEIEHLALKFKTWSNEELEERITKWRNATQREKYSIVEMLKLRDLFAREHPEADEGFFEAWCETYRERQLERTAA